MLLFSPSKARGATQTAAQERNARARMSVMFGSFNSWSGRKEGRLSTKMTTESHLPLGLVVQMKRPERESPVLNRFPAPQKALLGEITQPCEGQTIYPTMLLICILVEPSGGDFWLQSVELVNSCPASTARMRHQGGTANISPSVLVCMGMMQRQCKELTCQLPFLIYVLDSWNFFKGMFYIQIYIPG